MTINTPRWAIDYDRVQAHIGELEAEPTQDEELIAALRAVSEAAVAGSLAAHHRDELKRRTASSALVFRETKNSREALGALGLRPTKGPGSHPRSRFWIAYRRAQLWAHLARGYRTLGDALVDDATAPPEQVHLDGTARELIGALRENRASGKRVVSIRVRDNSPETPLPRELRCALLAAWEGATPSWSNYSRTLDRDSQVIKNEIDRQQGLRRAWERDLSKCLRWFGLRPPTAACGASLRAWMETTRELFRQLCDSAADARALSAKLEAAISQRKRVDELIEELEELMAALQDVPHRR